MLAKDILEDCKMVIICIESNMHPHDFRESYDFKKNIKSIPTMTCPETVQYGD